MAQRHFFLVGLSLCLVWARGHGQEVRDPSPLTMGVDAQGDPLPAGARARLGSTRFRMGGNIVAAAMSPNGRWIASSNNGDMVTLSDPRTGKEISRLRIPGGFGATVLAFSPDGQVLAVMGYGAFFQIVSIPEGKLLSKLQVPQPNMNRLNGLAFSGDGKIIIAGTDNFGQNKNFVHAWEVATGKPLHDFEVVQNTQIRGSLSQDGALLATSGFYSSRNGQENNPDQGRTVQLWDVKTGKELRKVKIDRNQVTALAMNPDGKTFAVASGSATFHLFETASGKELRRFAGRRGHTQFLQFDPAGKILAAGSTDGTVQLWEATTGKRLGLTDGARHRLFSLAFPEPGQVWALGMEGHALSLWNALGGHSLSPGDGHLTSVRFLAFTGDGKALMSGGADGKICWWDPVTAKELRHQVIHEEDNFRYRANNPGTRFNNYALSGDGKFLAAASDLSNNTIRLFDMTTAKVLCDFDAPRTNSPASFAFSPDNSRFAALGPKGVMMWDVASGQELPTLPMKSDPANGVLSGGSVAFSPDGKVLAGARFYYDRNTGNPMSEVYLWNIGPGTEIACLEMAGVNSGTMAFAPNGQILALPLQNQSVMLVKAATGRELGRLEGSRANGVQGLTFSPDGRLLAGAQQNNFAYSVLDFTNLNNAPSNRILVWELASGQIRQEFTGQQGVVTCLAFSPDGQALASGSTDTTIVLWDTSGKRSAKFSPLAPDQIEAAWIELGEKNGKRAYQELMTALISSPEGTIACLSKHLKPAQGIKANPEEIERLIADLDNDIFIVRAKATTALEQLGGLADSALRKAQLAQKSLEAQRRLKILLERLNQATLPQDEIRLARAVEVLEKIGTPQARAFLAQLAAGAPQNRLTLEAQAACLRLGR